MTASPPEPPRRSVFRERPPSRAARPQHASLRALLYHRIEEPSASDERLAPDLVAASPDQFERQLRHLTRFYHPVGAPELLAAIAGRHVLPRGAVLMTFDDGYRDFAEHAWPLLKQYRVPGVLFVVTAFAEGQDHTFWWDTVWQVLSRTANGQVVLPGAGAWPLHTRAHRMTASRMTAEWLKTLTPARRRAAVEALAEQLGVRPTPAPAALAWPALRLLAGDGATIAAHSRTHELLDQVAGDRLRSEVVGCRDDLVREMGACPPLFAYPNGNYSAPVVQLLESAGFQAGFTTAPGMNRLHSGNRLLIRRDAPSRLPVRFALDLSFPVATVRALRHPSPRYPLQSTLSTP